MKRLFFLFLVLNLFAVAGFAQDNPIMVLQQRTTKVEKDIKDIRKKISELQDSITAKQEKGDPGKDGSTWLKGRSNPYESLGNDNDWYFNTSSCDVYVKSNGSWMQVANIKGDKGATGDRGPKGDQGYTGERGPKGDGAQLNNIFSGDGFFKFNNNSGAEVAAIGCVKDGTGAIQINAKDGANKIEMGIREKNLYYGQTIYPTRVSNGYIDLNGNSIKDYAEVFEIKSRDGITPGTVIMMDESAEGIVESKGSYNNRVVGVISGAGDLFPGMRIGTRKDGTDDLPVAVSGQVYVRVCTQGGNINVGDLLVSSDISGVAMKAEDKLQSIGAVIGKALQSFISQNDEYEGLILMLVMNN